METTLSNHEIHRYSRHFNLPEVGRTGQLKLKKARIACVGAGGLGSPTLSYLAAAGIGHITIIDDDKISLSNLQRQILFQESELGQAKVNCAKKRLQQLNSTINIVPIAERLQHNNALNLLANHDIVIDGSDNFQTRYIINDACFHLKIPHVSASILRFQGQCSLFTTAEGPCYRCLFPTPPPPGSVPSCAEGGVLGVLPGMMGSIQACEAIKYLLGIGENLSGKLLIVDALTMTIRKITLQRDPQCLCCAQKQVYAKLPHHQLEDYCQMNIPEISVNELATLQRNQEDFVLLDVREQYEYDICHLNGLLIPLAELEQRLAELDPHKHIIVYCKVGGRSRLACQILLANGYNQVSNVTGGILAWAEQIDNTLAVY